MERDYGPSLLIWRLCNRHSVCTIDGIGKGEIPWDYVNSQISVVLSCRVVVNARRHIGLTSDHHLEGQYQVFPLVQNKEQLRTIPNNLRTTIKKNA